MGTVDVLVTTHKRYSTLVKALESLAVAGQKANVLIRVFCAHSDRRPDLERFSSNIFKVKYVPVMPDAFWASATRTAFENWFENPSPGQLLMLLNEDTHLYEGALVEAITAIEKNPKNIFIGSTCDDLGRTNYGIWSSSGMWPLNLVLNDPGNRSINAACANGNFIFMKGEVAKNIPFPIGYSHSRADFVWTRKLVRKGYSLVTGLTHSGTTGPSSPRVLVIRGLTLMEAFRAANGPMFAPYAEHWHFCREMAGILAPIYFVAPYARLVFSWIRQKDEVEIG